MDGLRRFLNGLKTEKEKDDFRRHLRRYVQIYLPDCPWEVNSTNRYTIVTQEASITARRHIKRNESIKYLSGIQVTITPEEEKEMSVRKKDFSIVVSSRNKCTSLFMGPARFANHDCDANAKLMTTSHAGIEIIATKRIQPGDEITVTYGESYFGDDNCECLCKSCETVLRNGWEQEGGESALKKSIEEDKEESYSLRRRRREESLGASSRTSSVNPAIRPRVRKTRPKALRQGEMRDSLAVDSPAPEPEVTPHGKKRSIDAIATPPITPAKRLKYMLEPMRSDRAVSRSSSIGGSVSSSSGGALETDVTSPEKDSPEPLMPTPETDSGRFLERNNGDQDLPVAVAESEKRSKLQPPSSLCQEPRGPDHRVVDLSPMSIRNILNAPVGDEARPVAPVTISIEVIDLTNTPGPDYPKPIVPAPVIIEILDDEDPPAAEEAKPVAPPVAASIESAEDIETPVLDEPARRKKYQRRVFIKQTTPPAHQRTPGDYVLTPLLLSQSDMAWIQCTNCPTHFVQQNAYFTKSSCPRCERHSKLYGYIWPKTEREGPSDKEQRILDHRTVHRFLDADDERKARGRKSIGGDKVETEELEEPQRGRTKKRTVKSTAKGSKPASKKDTNHVEPEEDVSGLRRSGRARRVNSRLSNA